MLNFFVLIPKMTAIIQIYILSPAKIMTINHRGVTAVDNYTVNGRWGVSLGKGLWSANSRVRRRRLQWEMSLLRIHGWSNRACIINKSFYVACALILPLFSHCLHICQAERHLLLFSLSLYASCCKVTAIDYMKVITVIQVHYVHN